MIEFHAPPCGIIQVDHQAPNRITYRFGRGGGLSPAGLTAVTAQVNTYRNAANLAALDRAAMRYLGQPTLDAPILRTTEGFFHVLPGDVASQVAALQAVIAGAGNAN